MSPSQRAQRGAPPHWLMAALMVCVLLVLIGAALRTGHAQSEAADVPPTPSAAATATAPPESTPSPTPLPQPDWSAPVPAGDRADPESWFRDAVFIGDSRTDGFHLYSGVQGGTFLVHNGLTVYEVMDGKKVIRVGEDKLPVLDILGQNTYGKIYLALGVNELGYYDPEGFADTCGELIDKLRELQPDALLYVQAIFPVNTAKCAANDQPDYISNENISLCNTALAAMAAEKEVFYIGTPTDLVDENGEVLSDLSSDGVHFKTAGYQVWLEWLLTHTGGAYLPQEGTL